MTSTYSSTSSPGGCNAGWTGDMYCDDINNNMECAYDGGDCCGTNVNTDYCQICGCLDPNGSNGGGSTTTMGPTTTNQETTSTGIFKKNVIIHQKLQPDRVVRRLDKPERIIHSNLLH